MPLLDHRAEHVGDRLVERPAPPVIRKPARHLRDPMRELVRDHVDRFVKHPNTTPSPSPYTICLASQNAIS